MPDAATGGIPTAAPAHHLDADLANDMGRRTMKASRLKAGVNFFRRKTGVVSECDHFPEI